jgi:two-component system chemotaxis response regulator CheB
VFVVVHTPSTSRGVLPDLLQRHSQLSVFHPSDGQPIQPGQVFVAPPDHHLLVKPGKVRVAHGPKENGFRPAIDPLFRSAAVAYGQRVIGVVLSGALDDGTHGLRMIKRGGGLAIVQHPEQALMSSMPLNAIQNVEIDHIVRVEQLAALLTKLAHEPVARGSEGMSRGKPEKMDVAEAGDEGLRSHSLPGAPSPVTCPQCGGALWELTDGKLFHYRCHVGHAFSVESLLSEKDAHLETALWTALRALEENADLQRRLAERTRARGLADLADNYDARSEHLRSRAEVIRSVLVSEPESDVEKTE